MGRLKYSTPGQRGRGERLGREEGEVCVCVEGCGGVEGRVQCRWQTF